MVARIGNPTGRPAIASTGIAHWSMESAGVRKSMFKRGFEMIDLKILQEEAEKHYKTAMERAENAPEPNGQKFPHGTKVMIAEDLGPAMRHFKSGVVATVKHTYAQAYGGDDVESYCLDIPGHGEVSWYEEWQLTAIADV